MVCQKDVCERCVCVKDGRVEKEEEEEEPGGTDPKTRPPHNDVGKKNGILTRVSLLDQHHCT